MVSRFAEPRILLADGTEENGLAIMVAGLIEQNMAEHNNKRRDFIQMQGRVAIVAEDAEVSMTLTFDKATLTVYDGIVGIPDVTVRASSDDVINMSLVEIHPSGLPDRKGENFRNVWAASQSGRIRVQGMWGNLGLMLKLTRVMSVN